MLGKVRERYGEGRVDRPSLKSELGGENRLKTRERMLVIVFDKGGSAQENYIMQKKKASQEICVGQAGESSLH